MSLNTPSLTSYSSSFLLDTVSIRQLNREWADVEGRGNYGWLTSGFSPSASSILTSYERLDLSVTTVGVVRGTNTLSLYESAAVSNGSFGWNISGWSSPSSQTSWISRIDFSNDSEQQPRAFAQGSQAGLAATTNHVYGWFGSGAIFGPSNTLLSRIDFSNDLTTQLARGGLLNGVRTRPAGIGNLDYGYYAGGIDSGVTPISSVQRIMYANDTVAATIRANLTTSRSRISGSSTPSNAWISGGSSTVVDRLNVATDTVNALARGNLPFTAYQNATHATANYGFHSVGLNSPTNITRIDYSNDFTNAVASGQWTLQRDFVANAAIQNYVLPRRQTFEIWYGNWGWTWGGVTPGGATSSSNRIDFSNDSGTVNIRTYLDTRQQGGMMANRNYGYAAGGTLSGSFTSSFSRVEFANDTAGVNVRTSATNPLNTTEATGNNNFGWIAGGVVSTTAINVVNRISYANDLAQTTVRAGLSTGKNGNAALTNSFYGWWGGGNNTSGGQQFSNLERIDFANDLSAISIRGNFNAARNGARAVGTDIYGWYAGATPSGSTIERVEWSNDTAATSVRGPLNIVRGSFHQVSNATAGWFLGGISPAPAVFSSIDRLEFANDLVTLTQRSSLANSNYNLGGLSAYLFQPRPFITNYGGSSTGNYGWIMGGYFSGFVVASSIDRFELANDNVTGSVRQNLNVSRAYNTGISAKDYSYAAVGYTGAVYVSSVERLDNSNENVQLSFRGALPQSGVEKSGFNTAFFGWVSGGRDAAGSTGSLVHRITFSSDLVTASARGNITPFGAGHAVFNKSYAWHGGFFTGSSIYRIDLQNDLGTASFRANHLANRLNGATMGNNYYGYFVGGLFGSNSVSSSAERIDYSNDTASPVTRFTLPSSIVNNAGQSSTDYGYSIGGDNTGAAVNPVSFRYRVTWTNDTASAVSSGSLLSAKSAIYTSGSSDWIRNIDQINYTVPEYNIAYQSTSTDVRLSLGTRPPTLGASSNGSYPPGVFTGLQNASVDDAFVTVPLGFNFMFGGTLYSTVYVGSNGYITFGSGSANFSSLGAANPPFPKLFFGAGDYSYQRVSYLSTSQYVRIRWEGNASTSGTPGASGINLEINIYNQDEVTIPGIEAGASVIELLVGSHNGIGSLFGVASASAYYLDRQGFLQANQNYLWVGTKSGTVWQMLTNRSVSNVYD